MWITFCLFMVLSSLQRKYAFLLMQNFDIYFCVIYILETEHWAISLPFV